MIKKIFLVYVLMSFFGASFAADELNKEDFQIQNRINDIGFRILNSNKLDFRTVFLYETKNKLIKDDVSLKRQIVLYKKELQQISDDNELAGYLSRKIYEVEKIQNGFISTMQMKLAPKKYELILDKIAVDYMVNAGYNPLALITFINKTYPEQRQDKLSKHNLTSKRLMNIYERIYYKYPYFLKNNEYIKNIYYQNFLLTSRKNREILNNLRGYGAYFNE